MQNEKLKINILFFYKAILIEDGSVNMYNSLYGLPFLSGFCSKDLILKFYSMKFINLFSCLFFFVSTGLTVSCTVRLIYYLFFGYLKFSPLFTIIEGGNIPQERLKISKGLV